MGLLDKYPLDLSVLQKGELIDLPTLEKITSKKHGTPEFQLAVLGIQDRINDRTAMTAKITQDGLRILTDSEASEYNQRLFHLGIGRVVRRHGKTLQVDVTTLQPDEQRAHENRLISQSRIVGAIANARRHTILPKRNGKQEPIGTQPSVTGDDSR